MTKAPNPIDVYVGSKLRLQRQMRQISQTVLADGLGITFQQVQKYEKGTNRISASRLQMICGILGVPISFFFKDDDHRPVSVTGIEVAGLSRDDVSQLLSSSGVLKLNRAFLAIKNPLIRRSLIALVEALANENHTSAAVASVVEGQPLLN